jgi:hypothetical protein
MARTDRFYINDDNTRYLIQGFIIIVCQLQSRVNKNARIKELSHPRKMHGYEIY